MKSLEIPNPMGFFQKVEKASEMFSAFFNFLRKKIENLKNALKMHEVMGYMVQIRMNCWRTF